MAKSYVSSVIDAPVAEVWKHLRSFAGLGNYLPAVKTVELDYGGEGDNVGVVRTITFESGESIRERLVALSDLHYSLSYHLIDEGALQFQNYTSHVRLRSVTDGDKTFIEWWSEYEITGDPAEVHDFVENKIYLTGMRGLQKLVS
jgi:Polyketide cyclase / dehydrase and lipid transport